MSIASSARSKDRLGLRATVAVASLLAGAIHGALVPQHAEEYWAFGLFFVSAAGFQVGWAVATLGAPSTRGYAIGALVNGLLVAVWIGSRTIGVPVGPDAWMPEAIRVPDVTASLAELAIVLGSLTSIRRMRPGWPLGARRSPR
jgi:hypothetical protein